MGIHASIEPLTLAYVPAILPDELLYSFLGRLCLLNAIKEARDQMRKIFGTTRVLPCIDMPTRIGTLLERLGNSSPWPSSDELIEHSTILPYYRPFLPPDRYARARKILIHGPGGSLKTMMGLVANGFGASPPLRYCTMCHTEAKAKYGMPYWLRAHQLPGVTTCYIHGLDLVVYHATRVGFTTRQFILPPGLTDSICIEADLHSEQCSFAAISNKLLHAELPAISPDVRTASYRSAIESAGFTKQGHLDYDALAQELRRYYASFAGYLHQNRLLSSNTNPLAWIRNVVDRSNRASHPICHLMLIKFLFGNLENFIDMTRIHACKDGSKKYTTSHESQVDCSHHLLEGALINRTLSCRDISSRFSLSIHAIIKMRLQRNIPVVVRPKKINDELLHRITSMLAENSSPATTAEAFGVSICSIYRILAGSLELLNKRSQYSFEKKLTEHRSIWSNTFNSISNPSIKSARILAKATYMWLYRNDREWLSRYRITQPIKNSTPRVKWDERDLAYCKVIQIFVSSFKSQDKRSRVSKSMLLRIVGESSVRKNIEKLPKLKIIIDSLVESQFEFQCIKIKKALDLINNSNQKITCCRIQKLSGIKIWRDSHQIFLTSRISN